MNHVDYSPRKNKKKSEVVESKGVEVFSDSDNIGVETDDE
jgi:hypothetical protein